MALNESYVLGAAPLVPELLTSRAQTENLYAPAGLPVVFQVNVAPAEYCWTSVQLPPGASIQNSYNGLGQPVAPPVMVTVVPTAAGDAGVGVAVMAVQGAVASVY